MPKHYLRSKTLVSIAAAAFFLAGCNPTPPLNDQEKKHMETLTKDMTPRCIGRYLIDLPRTMFLNSEYRSVIEGVTINITPRSKTVFEYELFEREEALKKTHMAGQPNLPFLKSIEVVQNGILGKIFNRAENIGVADFGRTLELHAWRDGYFIKMEINALDSTDKKYDDDAQIRSLGTDTPEKLSFLNQLLVRTNGRDDLAIPAGQGVCIPNGFIKGPATDKEDIGMAYELAEDVFFNFNTDSGLVQETNLLERGREINTMLEASQGRTVRKGRRDVNGQKIEEWLMAGKTNNKIDGNQFTLEINSKTSSAKTPLLIVDLHNGLRAPRPERPYDAPFPPDIEKATLSEAEAVALWDAVTQTLRPRPGAF